MLFFHFFFFIPPVMSDSFITLDGGAWRGDSPPAGKQWVMHKRMGSKGVKEPLVSSGAQPGTLIKGSQAAAVPHSPVCNVKAASSEGVGATSCCWPAGEYPLKWLDYPRVKWGALMTDFDVACLLGPHSGLTIIPTSLTVTACKSSTQEPCQACSSVLTRSPHCVFSLAVLGLLCHKCGFSSPGMGSHLVPMLCVRKENLAVFREDSCLPGSGA